MESAKDLEPETFIIIIIIININVENSCAA